MPAKFSLDGPIFGQFASVPLHVSEKRFLTYWHTRTIHKYMHIYARAGSSPAAHSCMHTHTHTSMHAHTLLHGNARTETRKQARILTVHAFVWARTCTYTRVCIYVHSYTRGRTNVYPHMYTGVSACLHTDVHIYASNARAHALTHALIGARTLHTYPCIHAQANTYFRFHSRMHRHTHTAYVCMHTYAYDKRICTHLTQRRILFCKSSKQLRQIL